ncbi:T9SS type A sorting domain-containing protein [Rhodocytophaga rosea]|uniref:T9SS type A sorting domain-containing protein n=1 Tax=Rhodocytophaga rosea TaxID=2704465 RepID=A0A6C0GJ75_9BACT|nr:T9SS type A sorting domain-containing protein [Rhodocytophaga rosea]QHT68025.1 T9SS type A sorting domain-containing protein [Rhodocytophaga rosea]
MGETLLPEKDIRRSTFCYSNSYDPALENLKKIYRKSLWIFSLLFIGANAWGQTFTGTGNWSDAARWGGAVPASGASVTINGDCSIDINPTVGNITINAGATLTANTSTIILNGNWTNNGTFTAGTSTVNLQGTIGSDVNFIGATTFYNLHASGAIKNNLTIFPGASISVTNSNNINLTGSLNIIGALTANNGTINIGGNVSIANAGSSFNAGNSSVSVGGTSFSNSGTFTAGTSTITFTSGSTATVNGTNANTTVFNNVTINKVGGTFDAPTTFTINGNLINTEGTFNADTGITISGNIAINGGTFNANTSLIQVGGAFTDGASATFNSGTSTIRFTGATSGVQIYGSPAEPFYNVEVEKNNANIQLATSLVISGNLIVNSLPAYPATIYNILFSFPGVSLDVQGDLQVNSGGINLSLQDNTYLTVNGATTVSGGKIFIARSTANSELKLNGGLTLSAGSIEVGTTLLTTQSKFSVTGNTLISDDGFLLANASTVEFFGDIMLAAPGASSKFTPFGTNVIITGNWESDSDGYFTGATSTVTFTGNSNTSILGVNRFANVTILKDDGFTVTNESDLIIDRDLLVQSGALILKNIPGDDMILNGNLTIANNASLDISDAISNPGNRIRIRISGNLTDLNDQEPNISPRRGLYVGLNPANPMGVRGCSSGGYSTPPVQLLPTIFFRGGNLQIITGRVKLRTYCGGIYTNEDPGIALPNVLVGKSGNVVQLNTNTNARIHGDLTIDGGEFFLNSRALFYGDDENDEILINTGGIFHANASSRIFMNTGTTDRGTFLKVDGGALKLIGTSTNPIVITREGTPGQYYRMAAYRGTVEAAYTTISYQGTTNSGFAADPISATAHTNNSNGGFKIYSEAIIDPNNLGYNFSYCTLGANAANNTTSLTINTGQTLNITGTTFNTSGSGGFNCVNNNDPNSADPLRTGIITFIASRGELGGVNGEAYDGGLNDTDGVIWETFTKIYWVGNTYDGRANAAATAWNDPLNWSLSPSSPRVNPDNVYPGQYPAPATLGGVAAPVDSLQQFEVFICASAKTSPVVTGNYVIQGTLVNNSVGRNDLFDLSPVIGANRGKRLDLNSFTLEVWGDFVNNSRDAAGGNITGGILDVNPGGTIQFKANFASFHDNSVIQVGSGFALYALGGAPLQEIKIKANDLYEFTINKPEGRVVVQGFGNDRLDILGNLNILSGGMEMLTNTPMRVDGNFNISGGFFTFNGSSTIIRGNWNNTGGTINTGAGTVNFYPASTDSDLSSAAVDNFFVRSNGQAFNVVNFGIVSDARGSSTPLVPASPAQTKYILVDDFVSGGLTTIAARGRIAGSGVNDYNDNPIVDANNPAQPRVIETAPNITVKVKGLRVRENGVFTIAPGASVFISNNTDYFAITSINPFNPFSVTDNLIGVRVEGAANGFPNGILNVIGTSGSYAKISRNDISGDYKFKVNGTISARYYFIEWMDAEGVNLTGPTSKAASPGTKNGGAASAPADCADASGCNNPYVASFSNGVLTNGSTAANAVYIQYTNNADVFGNALQGNLPDTVFNASFSKALGVNGVNIRRTSNVCAAAPGGILWFKDATGVLAGENFDNDGSACPDDNIGLYLPGQIRWRQPVIKVWDGGMPDGGDPTLDVVMRRDTATNWHTAANWNPDGVPTSIDNVVLDRSLLNADYVVEIYDGNAEVKDLDIRNDASLTAYTPAAASTGLTLVVDGGISLKVNGNFTVDVPTGQESLGQLKMISSSEMIIGGNWDNGGQFFSGNNSVVRFGAGFSGSRVINNVEAPAPASPNEITPSSRPYNTFYNVILETGTTEIVSHLLIKNDLNVSIGAVLDANAGSFPITIEGNWTNAGRFNPQRGLVTFAGNKQQTMIQSTAIAENFYDLKIEKRGNKLIVSDSVVFQSKATVANLLNLQNGRFKTKETNELIMLIDNIIRRPGASATTAHVKGPLGHLYSGNGISSRSFYLGDKRYPGVAKLNIALTNPSPNAATVFTMEQIDKDPDPAAGPTPVGDDRDLPDPFNYLSKSRYWKVKNIQFPPSGTNAELASGAVELPFAPDDERIDTTSNNSWVNVDQTLTAVLAQVLQASIVQDSTDYAGVAPISAIRGTAAKGDYWSDLGGVLNVNEDANDPDNTGVNPTMLSQTFTKLGNGDFTFAFNFTPLPVELLNFEAKKETRGTQLKWVTARELLTSHFIVQRSNTGDLFTAIGEVKAKGTSSLPASYSFIDTEAASKTVYYRLQIVDVNGEVSYSKIIAVSHDNVKAELSLVTYPNPFNGRSFFLQLAGETSSSSENECTFEIYDMLGKVVHTGTNKIINAQALEVIIDQALPQGIYILHVTSFGKNYQKKLIVK